MVTKYAVKDLISGKYMRWGGRGDRNLWVSLTNLLDYAFMYDSKGPATTFINQYENYRNQPHSITLTNMPSQYHLVVIEVAVEYHEVL